MVWFGNDILSILVLTKMLLCWWWGNCFILWLENFGSISTASIRYYSKSVSARDLTVVLLAILLAGPGTIATVITDSHEYFATIESKTIANLCLLFVATVLRLFF
ncbi:hypothetical protein [Francisella orientalis]|nr:hypothetical protein [Francisella orientalis]